MKRDLSEEQNVMHLYEIILSVIDQNGPASIPSICQHINEQPIYSNNREKLVQESQIKSVLSKKKDLFTVKNEIVSIRPEKDFVSLNVELVKSSSPCLKIRVDFIRKNFIYFEVNMDQSNKLQYQPVIAGSVDEFKQEIFRLKIWDWEANYEPDGIILDGTSWSIVLKTRANTYKSSGLELFPKEWTKFCRALMKLTGKRCCK